MGRILDQPFCSRGVSFVREIVSGLVPELAAVAFIGSPFLRLAVVSAAGGGRGKRCPETGEEQFQPGLKAHGLQQFLFGRQREMEDRRRPVGEQ